MGLTDLIRDIKVVSGKEERWSMEDFYPRATGPDDFRWSSLEYEKLSTSMGSGESEPHLLIMGDTYKTVEETEPIIAHMLKTARQTEFKENQARIKYSLFWTPEDFQKEEELTSLSDGTVIVESSTYGVNTEGLRCNQSHIGTQHKLKFEREGDVMIIESDGNYRGPFRSITDQLNPAFAEINVEKDDADRIVRRMRTAGAPEEHIQAIEKTLEPEQMGQISFGMSSTTVDVVPVISLTIAYQEIPELEQLLGKTLFNVSPKEETRVTKAVVSYEGSEENNVLRDLQIAASEIPNLDLGLLVSHPMIQNRECKEKIESELDSIKSSLERERIFGGLVIDGKRVATTNTKTFRFMTQYGRDLFGRNFYDEFAHLPLEDGLDYLKARSYEPKGSFDDKHPAVQKELHFVQFLREVLESQPERLMDPYAQAFTVDPPEVEITARRSFFDASTLGDLKLPKHARLIGFGIDEYLNEGTKYSNCLNLKRYSPLSDHADLFSRTSFDEPSMLEMQEYVLNELGVKIV